MLNQITTTEEKSTAIRQGSGQQPGPGTRTGFFEQRRAFRRRMVMFGASLLAVAGFATIHAEAAENETAKRLELSATVLTEIMNAPDKGIPEDLLESAHCVAVIPGFKKGAFIVSGQYGKGFLTCREHGSWSAPAAIRAEGGGIGFQIGGSETDLVLLVMNERGAKRLMSSEFTLGADGSVAAGPVGRTATAETDAKLTAEILSWSRTRGVFAGIALNGTTLRADKDDNADLYGKKLGTEEVIDGSYTTPPAGKPLVDLLSRYSPHEAKN